MLPRIVFGCACLLAATSTALSQSPVAGDSVLPPDAILSRLFVADFTADAVFALTDLDGDGDANDAGEIVSFYDTTSPDPSLHLATVRALAIGPDGALYVADANADFILRLEDLDGDGTANQTGEATIFYDVNSGGPGVVSLSNLVFDQDGYLYASDTGTSSGTDRTIVRLRDENGDGYCQEIEGELLVVYGLLSTTGTAIERPAGLLIDLDGSLVVSDYDSDTLFRLTDTAGSEDGDAGDAGEQAPIFLSDPLAGIALNFAEHLAWGLPEVSGRALYINSGPTEDVIWRFFDGDGDGFYANPTEITAFWDITQADGVIPANARNLALTPAGDMYVVEAGSGAVVDQIVVLTDGNGDGDANDAGEARIFADNTNLSGVTFGQPQGMAFELPPVTSEPEFIRGDCNRDLLFDIGDAIFGLSVLFIPGTSTDCVEACDSNDDGTNDIADVIYSLSAQFVPGSPPPPAPHPACGVDPTPDALDCASSSCP